MKTALYPGSFNPWHDGHSDVLRKACSIFDIVLVCQMQNLDKAAPTLLTKEKLLEQISLPSFKNLNFDVIHYGGLMVDAVEQNNCDAVVRGLRNGTDLEYEANLMYWNQHLGLKVPVTCFITEQHLSHLSSSGLRSLGDYKKRLKERYAVV